MIELTSDPDAICFLSNQQIILPLLKNQIDRRIIKITYMINKFGKRRKTKKHKYIQKDEIHQNQLLKTQSQYVLMPLKDKNIEINIKESHKKNNELKIKKCINEIEK